MGARRPCRRASSASAAERLSGPRAATFHSGAPLATRETNDSPVPSEVWIPSRPRSRSTRRPRARTSAQSVAGSGRVEGIRRLTWMRSVCSSPQASRKPTIGATRSGSGAQASGMYVSVVNKPDVGSSPSQPAPGTKTSLQQCKLAEACAKDPSEAAPPDSRIRWPQASLAARPRCRSEIDSSQARSQQDPLPRPSTTSGSAGRSEVAGVSASAACILAFTRVRRSTVLIVPCPISSNQSRRRGPTCSVER